MSKVDVDKLQQEAHEADAKAARAREKIEEHFFTEAERQREREAQFDLKFLDEYDELEHRLMEEEKAARAAFERELLKTPWARAYKQMLEARWRRTNFSNEARGVAEQQGLRRRIAEVQWREPRILEDVIAVIERAARDGAAAALDEHRERRDEFAGGAA